MGWINVNIGDTLHRKVKARAAEEGKKIEEVVVEALEDFLGMGRDRWLRKKSSISGMPILK